MPPKKVIEVQALIGDSTDNVPGVPGIGVKTAALLINEYGDLDTLLARASEITQPKRRESLITYADQARLSRTLVTLDCHVPLDVALDALAVHEADAEVLMGFMRKMEFSTLLRRVAQGLGAALPEGTSTAEGHAQEEIRLRPSLAPRGAGRGRDAAARQDRRRLAGRACGAAGRQDREHPLRPQRL